MPYLKCISKNRFYPTTSLPFTNDGYSFYFYSSTPIIPSKQTIMLFYKNGITTSYSTYIADGYIVYGYNNYIKISNGLTAINRFPRPSYDYVDVYQFDSIVSTDVSSLSIDNNSFIINEMKDIITYLVDKYPSHNMEYWKDSIYLTKPSQCWGELCNEPIVKM